MSLPVTTYYLEMRSAAELRPKHSADPRFRVDEATVKQWELNKFLYEVVGRQWRWIDRLAWTDSQWCGCVESEDCRTFLACYDGSPAGYFELRGGSDVEIQYLGLMPKFIGRGFGSALLTAAIEAAWRNGCERVWVHTCNLDHPGALTNYQARGMTLYRVETAPQNHHDS